MSDSKTDSKTDPMNDPTPTTLEWLRRCGAVRCGAVRCGAVRCGAEPTSDDSVTFQLPGKYRLQVWDDWSAGIEWMGPQAPLPGKLDTRGKVRRWFALHEVPFVEPPEPVEVWGVMRPSGTWFGSADSCDGFIAFRTREGAERTASSYPGHTVVRLA